MEEVLAQLFPPGVATALRPVAAPAEGVHPGEAALAGASGWAPARRREFLAGRACAHAALRALGRDGGAIGRGPAREPLWPAGIVGSIAHTAELAAAVAAPSAEARALGLDLERLDPPLAPAVERLVLTDAERAGSAGAHPRAAFAAKEAVYKALFPSTGRRLAFADVALELDLDGGRFRAAVADGPELEGRLARAGGHVLAGVTLRG